MKMLLAVTIAVCAMTTMASVAPLALDATALLAVDNNLQLVAGYSCSRDDRGWRYYRGDRRIDCRPSRPFGLYWSWRDLDGRNGWWHRRDNRWHS